MDDQYLHILKKYWGYDSFRPLQREIIESVAGGHDTLALMPTGGGKSLTFQVPALLMEGVCVVVTPLIALMRDQVQALRSKGIKATAVYSGLDYHDINQRLDNALYGAYKLLYLSPERLHTEAFLSRLKNMEVSMLVVDESHCISQWGYDFRPSYLQIASIRQYLPNTPVLALTATATPQVVQDIKDKLLMADPQVFSMGFERPNLHYVVRNVEDKMGQMKHILQQVGGGSAIVYVRNRKRTREVAEQLVRDGFTAEYYHAGLSNTERNERQQGWMTGERRIMVATNAFGMGIDKPDVRCVIHLDLPDNIESYFQEAGRAGRDGRPAYAVLLYNKTDDVKLRRRSTDNYPTREFVLKVYDLLGNYFQVGMDSGMGHSFVFDLEDFCYLNHLPMLPTHSAVKLLEQAGYLAYSEEVETKGKVRFIVDRDELYKFNNGYRQEQLIHTLLRRYTGIFIDLVPIDEEVIGRQMGWTRREVVDQLVVMAHTHIIRYVPRRRSPYITYVQERMDVRYLNIGHDIYEDRRERYEQKLADMIRYASQHVQCRSQLMAEYFGQSEAAPCGHCDICLERKRQPQPAETQLEQVARQVVERLEQGPMLLTELMNTFATDWPVVQEAVALLQDAGKLQIDAKMRLCLQQRKK